MSLADDLVKLHDINKLYDLLDEVREQLQQLEPQKKTLEHIEAQLQIAIAIAAGISKDTPVIPHIRGTVEAVTKTAASVSSSEELLNWAFQPGNTEGRALLSASVKKTAVEKYMDKFKQRPPGVKYNMWIEYKVGKPKGISNAEQHKQDRLNLINT